jgi:CRISPR-associated endonuclease/helicase Cas3
MHGDMFDPQALMCCLQEQSHRIDYRVEMMFDMLYDYIYDAHIENRPLHEKGLIITRSWEPSITIWSAKGDREVLQNAIEVPLRSCKMKEEDIFDRDWHVGKHAYNTQTQKREEFPLTGWECAYSADLIAYACGNLTDFDEEIGWVNLPKLFNDGFTQGYRRVLIREIDGIKHMLWYIAQLQEPESLLSQSVEEDSESEENEDDE